MAIEGKQQWSTPLYERFLSQGFGEPAETKSALGDVRLPQAGDPVNSQNFFTGGKMHTKYDANWDPAEFFGPLTGYFQSLWSESLWNYNADEPTFSGTNQPVGNASAGPFSVYGSQVGMMDFAGSVSDSNIKQAGTNFGNFVQQAITDYYGTTAGGAEGVWDRPGYFGEGIGGEGSSTPYDPGHGLEYDWKDNPSSTFGAFMKQYAGYDPDSADVGLGGRLANDDGTGLYDFTAAMYKPGWMPSEIIGEDVGTKVHEYINNRKVAADVFFGTGLTEEDAEARYGDWDPDNPYATFTPRDAEGNALSIDSSIEELAEAREAYGENTAMGKYINNLISVQGTMDDIGYMETGPYAGMYPEQKDVLVSLFGVEGTEFNEKTGSPLYQAKSILRNKADAWYSDPQTGQQGMELAFNNTIVGEQDAHEAYQIAIENASTGFFGIDDIGIDVLIQEGFLTEDWQLGDYDINPGTAVQQGDFSTLEGESEFAYMLRLFMDTNDIAGDSGYMNMYNTAYDLAAEGKQEGLDAASKAFTGEMSTISEMYSSGHIDLKQRMAMQKGLRGGFRERAKYMLENQLAESFGDSSINFGQTNEEIQESFDEGLDVLTNTLVENWTQAAGYGPGGNLAQAEIVRDDTLGDIFGTYMLGGDVYPNTDQMIQAFMSQGTDLQGTMLYDVDGDGQQETITLNEFGEWGQVYNNYASGKLGYFGTGPTAAQEPEGYSPGPDREFGTLDDESFVGLGVAGADMFGWKKEAVTTEKYGGISLPTSVSEDPSLYSGSIYSGVGTHDLPQYLNLYSQKLGTDTMVEGDYAEGAAPGEIYPGLVGEETTGQESEFAEAYMAGEGAVQDIYEQDVPQAKVQAIGAQSGIYDIENAFETEKGIVTAGDAQTSFQAQGVEAENASIDEWQKVFNDLGAQSVESQLGAMAGTLQTQIAYYMDDVGAKMANLPDKFFVNDYEYVDNQWKVIDIEEDSGGGGGWIVVAVVIAVVACMFGICIGSDRKLKKDIKKVGKFGKKLNKYEYKYINDPEDNTYIGLMADEVEEVYPSAILTMKNGFKAVNYQMVKSMVGRE